MNNALTLILGTMGDTGHLTDTMREAMAAVPVPAGLTILLDLSALMRAEFLRIAGFAPAHRGTLASYEGLVWRGLVASSEKLTPKGDELAEVVRSYRWSLEKAAQRADLARAWGIAS